MNIMTSRRTFLSVGSAAMFAGATGVFASSQQPPATTAPVADDPLKYVNPPALNGEDVRAFVGAAHRDIDRVRALLDAQPSLVNATWDWGGGDYESALGAAGHTGQVEIAELVLARGARIELHAAAMLGWLDVIKAAVAAQPGAENILGPHAIPVHSHARTGEDRSKEVLAFLESLDCVRDVPTEEAQRLKIAGRYRIEDSDDVLTVLKANRRLLLQPPAESRRRAWYMLHQGEGLFRPADALQVKITFEVSADGETVKAMHIDAGDDPATAARVQ